MSLSFMRRVAAAPIVAFMLAFVGLLALAAAPDEAGQPATGHASTLDPKDFLEGIWLIGENPTAGSCASQHYMSNQLEFEFRKSGGRLLIFEPPDLFNAIQIAGAEHIGDEIVVNGRSRAGNVRPLFRLKILGDNQFQFLSNSLADQNKRLDVAYRCGAADRTVDEGVPMERLAPLTPAMSGSQGLIEIAAGESDREVCEGKASLERPGSRRWLQFELLGPVHYWLFSQDEWGRKHFEYDLVRSVHIVDGNTLKLDMQERPPTNIGWNVTTGKKYTLTIISDGDHIRIPELSTTFVHCRPDEAGSLGMHRL